jgi:hypothetical protein
MPAGHMTGGIRYMIVGGYALAAHGLPHTLGG